MFWCKFGEWVLASGNNYTTLNEITQEINNQAPFRVDAEKYFLYFYLFAGIDCLEARIRKGLGL